MKITNFKEIPQFTSEGSYQVDMDLCRIPDWIDEQKKEMNLNLNPPFQRGHVWTEKQQIAWLEYFLKGGKSGNIIYFNCPSWNQFVAKNSYNDFVCVDGLQRLTAICRFINNKIKVFDSYYDEYEGKIFLNRHTVKFNINDLKTEKEVLQWYVDMNAGGTPHTDDEINKVKEMIANL